MRFIAHGLIGVVPIPQSMAPLGLGCEQLVMRVLGLTPRGDVIPRIGVWVSVAKTATSIVVRTVMALAALGVVTVFPSFGLVMGVIGATCSFSLAVTLPAIFYLCIFWRGLSHLKRTAYSLLVMFGITSTVLGTVSSIARHAHHAPPVPPSN